MSLIKLLLIIAAFLIIILLVLFPEFRKLCMGWTRLFIKDMATTPEGAAAIYEEKINEARDSYNKAENALRIAAGKLQTEKDKLERLKIKKKEVEKACELLVKQGDMESASIKAEERSEIISDIERSTKLVSAYTTAKAEAEELHKACGNNLRKLQRESKDVVENMKVKTELNKVYDEMDDLKKISATDKLLDSVRDKNKDLDSSVEGARAIHNNRITTKVAKADEKARKLESDDYLSSLQKKYNK